jgi:hypothetical protein
MESNIGSLLTAVRQTCAIAWGPGSLHLKGRRIPISVSGVGAIGA